MCNLFKNFPPLKYIVHLKQKRPVMVAINCMPHILNAADRLCSNNLFVLLQIKLLFAENYIETTSFFLNCISKFTDSTWEKKTPKILWSIEIKILLKKINLKFLLLFLCLTQIWSTVTAKNSTDPNCLS